MIGTDENAAYGSSKAAIIQLTRTVATMYGHDSIRCNAVAPGLILTPRNMEVMGEERLEIYAAERLLPWPAAPEDIAAVVAWLASDEAHCITGQTIVVDSGTLAHRPRHAMKQWEQSRAARGRMDQARLAGLQRERGMREVMRGHALEHDRRAIFEGDALRQFDHNLLWHHRIFGVRSAGHRVGDALSDGKTDAFTDRGDDASAFAAELHWSFRSLVCAVAKVDVDEVNPDGFELD